MGAGQEGRANPVEQWYRTVTPMTPQRRITDRDESMERAFALLRDEMREGFSGLAKRLETMDARVNSHGEAIAALKTGCLANSLLSQQVQDLSETMAAHRARCPYDAGGDVTANAMQQQPRWNNGHLVGGIASGGDGALALIEFLKWLMGRQLP